MRSIYLVKDRFTAWTYEGGKALEPILGVGLFQKYNNAQMFTFKGQISDDIIKAGLDAIEEGYVFATIKDRERVIRLLNNRTILEETTFSGQA